METKSTSLCQLHQIMCCRQTEAAKPLLIFCPPNGGLLRTTNQSIEIWFDEAVLSQPKNWGDSEACLSQNVSILYVQLQKRHQNKLTRIMDSLTPFRSPNLLLFSHQLNPRRSHKRRIRPLNTFVHICEECNADSAKTYRVVSWSCGQWVGVPTRPTQINQR